MKKLITKRATKTTTKQILKPEEIATIKAARKILKRLDRKHNTIWNKKGDNEADEFLSQLYKEAEIDVVDDTFFFFINY